MDVPEATIRRAIINAWDCLRNCETSCHEYIHSDCSVLIVLDSAGKFVTGKVTTMKWPPGILEFPVEITCIKITPSGKKSSSSAQVKFGSKYTGFFVFLQEEEGDDHIWKCISLALGPVDNEQIVPSTYEQMNKLTWDGYCYANRICDGELMSKYFHPTCRLTYTGPDGRIIVYESEAFYAKVSGRYEHEEPHKPYAHLKDDPRIGDANTLLSITFASSQVGMVVLKVGHPPFLWTDLLTCARISHDGSMQWWIVHKSSDCEPHPLIR